MIGGRRAGFIALVVGFVGIVFAGVLSDSDPSYPAHPATGSHAGLIPTATGHDAVAATVVRARAAAEIHQQTALVPTAFAAGSSADVVRVSEATRPHELERPLPNHARRPADPPPANPR